MTKTQTLTHIRQRKARVDIRTASIWYKPVVPDAPTLCGADYGNFDLSFADSRSKDAREWVTCDTCWALRHPELQNAEGA